MPYRMHILPGSIYLLLVIASLSLIGCEEDVVAITGIDSPFTIYGVLSPESDTQQVALYAIEDLLQPIQPEPLDAILTSMNLDTDSSHQWGLSFLQDSVGRYTHLYSSAFQAQYDNTYRIEIARSDGEVTMVEVRVPPLTELVLPPPLINMPTVFPIFVEGDAPKLIQIEITYRVKYDLGGNIIEQSYRVFYDGVEQRTINGWTISVNVQQDMRDLKSFLVDNGLALPGTSLKPVELAVNLIVANAEWDPPGGVFDRDVLVQPGLLSNVDNGFGFLGAGYRLRGKWAPLDSIITTPLPGTIFKP